MSGHETVLFDLDGTLIDSIELILSSYRHTLEVHRGESPPDEVWLQGLGTPLWDQFEHFTTDPLEIDAMVATYREHNRHHHDRLVRRYPGVNDAVRALAERATVAIVTSKLRAAALQGLARCGFDGVFRVVVGADDVERHKPHPDPVRRALVLLGADADTTVFVGDSPHDMASGHAAGVRTAAALWGPFPRTLLEPEQPDYWLEAPADLLRL